MIRIVFILLIFPVVSGAQKIKFNEYDKFLKQRKVETFPLTIQQGKNSKTDLSLRSDSLSFSLQLSGTIASTNIIGENEQVIFLFDNDSTVTLKSSGLQSYEMGQNSYAYIHNYILTIPDLVKLSTYNLQALREYDSKDFSDVVIPENNREKIKELSSLFIDELKKVSIIKPYNATRVADFPGGEDAWTKFLKRNLQSSPIFRENTSTTIQFRVSGDGAVTNIEVLKSGGTVFDAEVLRVLKRMPKWKPAMKEGGAFESVVTRTISLQRDSTTVGFK